MAYIHAHTCTPLYRNIEPPYIFDSVTLCHLLTDFFPFSLLSVAFVLGQYMQTDADTETVTMSRADLIGIGVSNF